MSNYTDEYTIKCWNDCQMSGCPGHAITIESNNTSDALLYTKDGEAKFGMDFDELEAFIQSIYKLRHWVEIERIFNSLAQGTTD